VISDAHAVTRATTCHPQRIPRKTLACFAWPSAHILRDRGAPGYSLVRATGRLPDGTWVDGYYNAGSTAAEVRPWPIEGFG